MVGRALAAVNASVRRVGARVLVWGAVLAVLALVLDFVPLFDILGYDFSFALGLVTALAAVDVGHGVAARWRRTGAPTGPAEVTRLVGTALGLSLAMLVVPLLLSLANGARVRNCSVGAGLGFFALLPVATAIYAAPAGLLAGLLAPRRGRLLAFALPVASVGWTLLRLYRDPAVFAFDPFGGYFPGPIYDEALRPPLRLITFRLMNLVWIATAVELALAAVGRGWDPRRWRASPGAMAALLLATSLALFGAEGRLNMHVARADLERALDRTLRTDHFVLHYAGTAGKSRAELALEAEDLEFRYAQLVEILKIEPELPITVWEFPGSDAKKALVGAGQTLFAKPWTREIFVQSERFPSTRLRHEMAHVFASAFGDPLFGISFRVRMKGPLPVPVLAMGLVEGLAEAADAGAPDGSATIHQEAAAMIADGRAPPLEAVVGAGFTTLAGARAYTIAGSFSTFLLARSGPEALRALYHSAGDFEGAYHVPLAQLEAEWRQFLRGQPLSRGDRARAREQFRQPAIFKKVCARELAARVGEARALMGQAPEVAVRLLEAACTDDPHEPIFRLTLARAKATAGDRAGALAILGRLQADADLTDPLLAQASSLAAEIHFHAADFANAIAAETRARELATDENDRRQAQAKLQALSSPPARQTLGRVLFGDDPQAAAGGADPVLAFFLVSEYARLFPNDALGPYLVGRQLLARDAARALPYLRRACGEEGAPPPPSSSVPLGPDFARECQRMIAEAGYRVGDYPRARAALAALAAPDLAARDGDARDGDKSGGGDQAALLRVEDMRARVEWAAARRSGPVGESPSR
jgi:hypothetical protein